MDFESVADELYSLPRDEFTAARNAAAQRARKRGDRGLAEQISALRRPSTAAWVANLLAREQPEQVRALVTLGDGLREAQHRMQGEQLRRLSAQRHQLVEGLVAQAQSLARAAGHPVSDAVGRELGDTFTAAVNSSAAARALAGGRLTAALDPADAATDLFAGAGAAEAPERPPDRADRGDDGLHEDLARLRRAAADAETTRDQAQHALTDADRAARHAAAALLELRRRLEAAERAEQDARRQVHSTRQDFESADGAARDARRRVDDLQRRLAQRDSG